jgi:hypothetical protein
MDGIFLLEFYTKGTDPLPEFALSFSEMQTVLDYIENNITRIDPEYIKLAVELGDTKPLGEAQSLNDDNTIKVTFIPYVHESKTIDFNKYITGSNKETKLIRTDKCVDLPIGAKDSYTTHVFKNGDLLVDYEGNLKKGIYVELYSFLMSDNGSKYKRSPTTRKAIAEATLHRVRITGLPPKLGVSCDTRGFKIDLNKKRRARQNRKTKRIGKVIPKVRVSA